jgi:DNA-binding transcriptional LysR family regulator
MILSAPFPAMSKLSEVNLNRLVSFVAVADARSITAAAARLGLAKTMVSKHMQLLEAELGVALLARSTRKISLTEAGQGFYEASQELLASAEAAIDAARAGGATPHGRLRVTAPNDYGVLVVAPVLSQLRRKYPELNVELVCCDQLADLIADGIDVAVRLGNLASSNYRAARVGCFAKFLVASPDFIRAHGGNADNWTAISRLPFIAHTVLPQPAAFTLHGPGAAQMAVRMERTIFASNTAYACRAAAVEGDGVALMTDFAIANDLRSGTLVKLMPQWEVPAVPIHAVYPATVHVPQKVRVFIDALKAASDQAAANAG